MERATAKDLKVGDTFRLPLNDNLIQVDSINTLDGDKDFLTIKGNEFGRKTSVNIRSWAVVYIKSEK